MHPATALYVMVASPSDVLSAREAAYKALSRWNESNSATRNIVLVPLRWETGTVPVLGGAPQAIINKQMVEKADIVIALFGSRLGEATPDAVSGTVEEIERAESSGKPVHLYFSKEARPNEINPEQLRGLLDFQKEVEKRGLFGTFNSPEELTANIWQAIEHDLRSLTSEVPEAAAAVDLLVQPGQESLPKTDSRGRLRYETKRWIEITNRGDVDADDVEIVRVSEGLIPLTSGPTTIHSGQVRRFPFMLTMGAQQPVVQIHWSERGESRDREYHVG